MNSIFTDEEHRILLSAISRERKICEECDREIGDNDGYMLVPIVDSIERKVYEIQHQDADLKKHFLVATEPEWDQKNRFYRCPSCKRRIHEYHGFCKHCGKKIDWQPFMKKRKKEAEIKKTRGSKARITRRGLEEIARNREKKEAEIRGRKEDRKKTRTGTK